MIAIALALAAASTGANCDNAMTQMDINACMAQDYRTADGELNRQWVLNVAAAKAQDKTRIAQTDKRPGYYATLLESQRAWLKFRDTQCVVEGGQYAGGSMQGMVVTQCKTRMTRARTAQLSSLIKAR